MSRSRSPHYSHRISPRRHEDGGGHRFPWDDPDFDPQRVLADLGKLPWEENRYPGEAPEAQWARFMDEIHPEAQRRPRSPAPHRSGHHHHHLLLEEYHRRTPPPPHELGYAERRRLSPQQLLRAQDGGGDGRGRGGLKEDFQRYERKRQPHSPQRLPRERLSSFGPSHPDRHQREPSMGWRRERHEEQNQGRVQRRSRDRSPRERSQDWGGGEGRERGGGDGDVHRPFGDRQREDHQRERNAFPDRHWREMDEAVHPGYGKQAEFRGRHPSLEKPRGDFGGGPGERRGGYSRGGGRVPGPLIVEHDHGIMSSGGGPGREFYENRGDHGPDRNLERDRDAHHPRPGPSPERFRKSNSRSNTREEARGHPLHDARGDPVHEARRSPIRQGRISPGRGSPMDHRGRSSPGHGGRRNPARGGRREMGPSRNQPHPQLFHQGQKGYGPRDTESPQEHQRPGFRPREAEWDTDSRDREPDWEEETNIAHRWEHDRPRGGIARGRPLPGARMGHRKPQQRDLNPNWNQQQKNNPMATPRPGTGDEETLTIKVDMKRPVGQNSQLCYSSDRQLSLDLVNVGRQRLDFLPMMEHSGTYRESTTRSGTFAQEIITLVHQVKEHYFRGEGITLDQRFSGPQDGGLPEEEGGEEEEVVVEERPTLNRRFNMSMNMSVLDTEPLFSKVGRMKQPQRQQAVSDPGDLRHDLERRRQERLEGVKVTIPGGTLSQRPLASRGDQNKEYVSEEEVITLEEDEEGFSGWSEEPERRGRWGGDMGQKRGGPFRQNMGVQRRNNRPPNRPGNRLEPMRRPNRVNANCQSPHDGANW